MSGANMMEMEEDRPWTHMENEEFLQKIRDMKERLGIRDPKEHIAEPSGEFYSYLCITLSEVHQVDVRFLYQGKEPNLVEQENPDDEEKIDYEIDVYFTEPNYACFESNIGKSYYMLDEEPSLEIMDGLAPTSLSAMASLSL
ncbi:uncharacterized protein A4U43_C07F27370 [Asparagus officinalis]|uniref:Uncharacterized protein n=1 Tax=Asparagus officinalis TaxID=4686 RepID=A0A5P1EKJ1_ASPOF|nr:uncharacterized protein A4U43_C07F27370 [Asparagus officinalis]